MMLMHCVVCACLCFVCFIRQRVMKANVDAISKAFLHAGESSFGLA